jgi:hypothetical protein
VLLVATSRRGELARSEQRGELIAVPVAPAIANAIYHAVGKPVRDVPITWRSCCDTVNPSD